MKKIDLKKVKEYVADNRSKLYVGAGASSLAVALGALPYDNAECFNIAFAIGVALMVAGCVAEHDREKAQEKAFDKAAQKLKSARDAMAQHRIQGNVK